MPRPRLDLPGVAHSTAIDQPLYMALDSGRAGMKAKA